MIGVINFKEFVIGIPVIFLMGLSSGADNNRDRKITATEMNKYLNNHVPDQAKTMGREQYPQLLGSDLSRVILTY